MRRSFLLVHGLGVLVLTGFLEAQREPAWVEQVPTSARPEARYGHAMAFYPPTGRTVLVGGRNSTGGLFTGYWQWQPYNPATPLPPQNGTWTSSASGPPARLGHSMVFDPVRSRITLFGGVGAGDVWLNDTWVWSGSTWTQLSPTTRPAVREEAAMAFDSARGRIVLFGGWDGHNAFADTWEFDGTNWIPRFPTTFPSPRSGAGMAFDAARGRMVLYGGEEPALGETWEYDGTNWSQVFPTQSPGPRETPVMAFDAQRGVTVLSAGWFRGNETWEYDGITWRQRMTPIPLPYPRGETAMAFDSTRNRMVMFGGLTPFFYLLNDTWEYHFPYGCKTWGSGCEGSEGVPSLWSIDGSPGLLGQECTLGIAPVPSGAALFVIIGFQTSSWSGGSLPAELTPQGMPGCMLYVSVDLPTFVLASGTSATFNVRMPSNPIFLGYELHHQALVFDSLAGNPLGAVMTNAATVVIGN